MRYGNRRDATEQEIVEALRAVGAQVLYLTMFDLLVLFRGQLYMIDAKVERGKPTPTQVELCAKGWPLHFVTDGPAALSVIGLKA